MMSARRFHLLAALPAVATVALTGCYTYVPVASRTPAGVTVDLTLTDMGRVALAPSLGPEVWRVEGVVRSSSDSTIELYVRRTVGISRATVRWGGEPVTIRTEHVQSGRERHLNKGRTALLAGTVAGGVVAFIVTRGLGGFGWGDEPGIPGNPGGPPGNQ